MAGVKWTPGRVVLVLFVAVSIGFFISLFTRIAATLYSASSSIFNSLNATTWPPELKTLAALSTTLFALLASGVFVAILIAAGVLKDVLRR